MALASSVSPGALADSDVIAFDAAERAMIQAHGPWPPAPSVDVGNRYSGRPQAIDVGRRLFHDARLSNTPGLACAVCHQRERGFADNRTVGAGRRLLDRNTPSLLNLRYQRWFGWDGGSDSLWAQSIRPILDPREMNADARSVRALLGGEDYHEAVAALAPVPVETMDDDAVLALVGKLLAAFQETLVTPPTAFDAFREAWLAGDMTAAARYPLAAQRGLKLFTGRGRCSLCHFGPTFSNGEFANIGIPHRTADGGVDRGRLAGLRRLASSVFSLTGPYNDDASGANALPTRHLRYRHDAFGEFRVPGLRGAVDTAPYMHNGSLATLHDVVGHYNDPDMERLHVHGERILEPLGLDEDGIADLVAFLESLSAPPPAQSSRLAPGQVVDADQEQRHGE